MYIVQTCNTANRHVCTDIQYSKPSCMYRHVTQQTVTYVQTCHNNTHTTPPPNPPPPKKNPKKKIQKKNHTSHAYRLVKQQTSRVQTCHTLDIFSSSQCCQAHQCGTFFPQMSIHHYSIPLAHTLAHLCTIKKKKKKMFTCSSCTIPAPQQVRNHHIHTDFCQTKDKIIGYKIVSKHVIISCDCTL